jgi:hypothetical protein
MRREGLEVLMKRNAVEARVVALCDAFDTLTHERPWKATKSLHVAQRIIEREGVLISIRFGDQIRPDAATGRSLNAGSPIVIKRRVA